MNSKLTASYQYNWDVWILGVRVGTLATDCRLPHAKVKQRFTFKNSILYTGPGWYHYLYLLTAATGLRFSSIGFLELALDFQPKHADSDACALLHDLDNVYKYLPRKYNTDVRFSPIQGKLQITHNQGTFYFGGSVTSSKGSGKQVVVYCKSAEIAQSQKDYITDFHQRNGLDSQRAIVRVEARLGSKYLRGKIQLTEHDLLDIVLLEALFVDAVGQSFKFRDKSHSVRDEHRNLKYPIKELISFSFLNQAPMLRPEMCFPAKEENNDRTNACTVKRLTIELINYDAPETQAELLRFIQVNPAPNGQDWLRKIGYYAQQYPGMPNPEQMTRISNIFRRLED